MTTTTVAGHSAGGHLALWLANEPLPLHRVVALAPVGDLRAAAAAGLGDGAVEAFLGGTPTRCPSGTTRPTRRPGSRTARPAR